MYAKCEQFERQIMENRISIQQIAAEAGVSIATVSRVINAPEKVAEHTRKRIEAIIQKYHYQPNLLAQGLRNNQMPIVGILVPDLANEFFANIVIQLQQDLFHCGYWAIICNSNKSKVMQLSYLKMLIDQNISGMIAISFDSSPIAWPGDIPTVFVDRRPMDCDCIDRHAIVESDNYQGGYMATQELIACGCRKIALITTCDLINIYADRERGYRDALKQNGIDVEAVPVQRMDSIGVAEGAAAIDRLLDSGIGFDGVFATADLFAMGALQRLKQRNISVPGAVQLVGFDDMSMTEYSSPSITSVHQYSERLAAVAVECLRTLMEPGKHNAMYHKIPVKLIQRDSTKRP